MTNQTSAALNETSIKSSSGKKTGKVVISAISKRFGSFDALHPISLEIEAGKYCTLLGPSGCGKTTLLRIIAGHDSPSGGNVSIDGRSIIDLKTSERGTAMMFQSYALFPHLSVLDNVAFALKMRGESPDKRYGQARLLLEKVGLETFSARLPSALSGGQQQRVALARALITDPTVLLLDEPLSALDEFLRLRMRSELRRIQNDLGITFIHVTHSQLEAIGVSDMVVVMDKGRVVQAASPNEIYTQPANTHVARFIGGQNVIDGVCTKKSGKAIIVRNQASGSEFSVSGGEGVAVGDRVTAVIRKDRVSLHEASTTRAAVNHFNARIDAIEYQGSYVTVTLSSPFTHEFIATIPDNVFAAAKLSINAPVTASFAAENTLFIAD